jgi:hypothetical protein
VLRAELSLGVKVSKVLSAWWIGGERGEVRALPVQGELEGKPARQEWPPALHPKRCEEDRELNPSDPRAGRFSLLVD